MNYEYDDDQRAILEAVEALLAQHAGPARAIELAARGDYDQALDSALRTAGFSEIAGAKDTGPLEAALVVEAVSRAGGVVALASSALVLPGVVASAAVELPFEPVGPVALRDATRSGPVRFGSHARTLLTLDGDQAFAASAGSRASRSKRVSGRPGSCCWNIASRSGSKP